MQSIGRNIVRWVALAAAALLVACGGGGGGSGGAPTYTVGGNVSVNGGGALASGLVLQVNGGDSLARSSTGTFTFATPLASSTTYTVTVSAQPATQNCVVTGGGTGTVGSTNVTTVVVECTDKPTHTVGGTITNYLLGTGLSLQLNGTSTLPVSGSSMLTFTFAMPIAEGNPYTVTVATQPSLPAQVCTVANGTGTMGLADIASVSVTCGLPAPKFAYVLTQGDDRLTPYSVNPTTGSLTTVSTAPSVAVGTFTTPWQVAIDPLGRTAWVASEGNSGFGTGSGSVIAYGIDATTGALTARAGVPINGLARSLAFHPSGRFVYVASFSGVGVTAISVNSQGLPLAIIGTIAAGSNPQSIKVDATGKFAYVSNATSNTISLFSISSTTGSLTFVAPDVAAGGQPSGIGIDPQGRYVFVANSSGNTVGPYAANTATGVLTAGTTAAAGGNPNDIAVDPLGRFAFAVNNDAAIGNSVTPYQMFANSASLIPGSSAATGLSPWSATVDSSGKFLYAVGGGVLTAFTINQTSGALSPPNGDRLSIGGGNSSIAILPSR